MIQPVINVDLSKPDVFGRYSTDPKIIEQDAGWCIAEGEREHWWSSTRKDGGRRFFWSAFQRCLGVDAEGYQCKRVRLVRVTVDGLAVQGYVDDPMQSGTAAMMGLLEKALDGVVVGGRSSGGLTMAMEDLADGDDTED